MANSKMKLSLPLYVFLNGNCCQLTIKVSTIANKDNIQNLVHLQLTMAITDILHFHSMLVTVV
jgi:hypothetical protein